MVTLLFNTFWMMFYCIAILELFSAGWTICKYGLELYGLEDNMHGLENNNKYGLDLNVTF